MTHDDKVSNQNNKHRLHHLKMYRAKQQIIKSEMAHFIRNHCCHHVTVTVTDV